jgi:hypothetical protein
MINNAAFTPVGILGLGFLGQILAREFSAVTESWGTWHLTPPQEPILSNFSFDWANENNWSALPEISVTLVLTIPPLLKNPDAEAERLHLWGKWMRHNRPELKRLLYISTTGVYPKCNGIWSEDSDFEADTNSGKLRLLTENILSQYFSLQVVRPGGIYGSGRGIDVRLKSRKLIPVSNTPVHRIHVKDLARIICYLVDNPDAPNCVNAVDFEARPSWEVASWLVENRDDLTKGMLPDADDCLPGTPQRFISNQRLLELGIILSYPTFREGMGLLFEN